jgi:hypothetical protein
VRGLPGPPDLMGKHCYNQTYRLLGLSVSVSDTHTHSHLSLTTHPSCSNVPPQKGWHQAVLDPTQDLVTPHSRGTDAAGAWNADVLQTHCDVFIFPAKSSHPDGN